MILTWIIFIFDVVSALIFAILITSTNCEQKDKKHQPIIIRMLSIRKFIYLIVSLVLSWRAYDIVESGRMISDIGAIFNIIMTSSLLTLAFARKGYKLP